MSVVEASESLAEWATERLETEITMVAAHLAAGECRFLQLVAEFDRRRAWGSWGCVSAAHWLNYRCSLDLGAARERVRVARALEGLPRITAAFSVGRLSYSKVRALTRVATADSEEEFLNLAVVTTASQLETVVRQFRQVTKPHDDDGDGDGDGDGDRGDRADRRYRERYLSMSFDDDGFLILRAKLPPVEGALLHAMLRRAGDAIYRQHHAKAKKGSATDGDVSAETPQQPDDDVSAETPRPDDGWDDNLSDDDTDWRHDDDDDLDWDHQPGAEGHVSAETPEDTRLDVSAETPGDSDDAGRVRARPVAPEERAGESPAPWYPWGAMMADALTAMAETFAATGLRAARGPQRHHVTIHTTLNNDGTLGDGHLHDGPWLPQQTIQRLLCDTTASYALRHLDGTTTTVPAGATLPAAVARAVTLRDHHCVFPGCTRRLYLDIHHIHWRSHGGRHSVDNCAALCRHHHRLIHEGGYTMVNRTGGGHQFYRPDGTPLTNPTTTVEAGDHALRRLNTINNIHPSADNLVPDWDGTRPDYPLIIDTLLYNNGLLDIDTPIDIDTRIDDD